MTNLRIQDFTLVGYPDVIKHPMWRKMWQRAGIDPKVATQQFQPIYNGLGSVKSPVITLGEPALRYVTGESDLFRWHGRQLERNGLIVYPVMDPANLLPFRVMDDDDDDDVDSDLNRSPARFQGAWVWEIHQALGQGLRPRPLPSTQHYAVDPPLAEWNKWVDYLLIGPRLSFDIETAYKMSKMDDEEWEAQGLSHGQMLRISFATKPGYSVSVPWHATYLPGIIRLLTSPLDKIVWNGFLFDVPRLAAEGIQVAGRILDYQDAWHLYQSDLPKGLEWVSSRLTTFHPWKHLANSNPGLYSCIDSDAALQIADNLDPLLEKHGMTDLFDRHVVRLMPILKRAGERGNAIDVQYSYDLEKVMIAEKDRLTELAQPLIPQELKPTKRYKTEPPVDPHRTFQQVMVEKLVQVCSVCDQPASSWAEHMKGRKKPTKKEPDVYNRCKAAGAQPIDKLMSVPEWDEILSWNPNSADQIKAYIRHYGHPMGKNRQTDQDSANSKHLEKLVKKYGQKHPIYRIVTDYKKVAKTISTYVYHNYMDSAGFIHQTYVNGPSTWRLAGRNVNLTNVGKRESNPWAQRARRQIIARPGHCFVGADSTSIEAVIVGFLINDPDFIRMAGKSIHAWLCCQELGWEFNPDTMEKVKTEYKDLYNKMKTAIYLLLYGGDPYLMHMENPDNFPTLQDAKIVQDKIFALLPKLKDWQDRQREQAKKSGVLTSVYGYKHYFYDVYTFKKNKYGVLQYHDNGEPMIKLGKDAKRCLAFEPQNTAAGFGRDTLLLIGEHPQWGQYMPANVFVHDGYTLEVPLDLKDQAEQFLVDTLTRPVPELGGLRIGCETEWGLNWAEVDKKDPKTGKYKLWDDGNPDGMRVIRKVEM